MIELKILAWDLLALKNARKFGLNLLVFDKGRDIGMELIDA